MKKLLFSIFLAIGVNQSVHAEACPNAKLLGSNLISNIDWSNVYPMRFGGKTIQGSMGWIPDGAYNGGAMCTCYDRFGVPEFGVPSGMWEPAQVIEVNSKEWCSSVAGGIQIGPEKLPIQDAGESIKTDFKQGAFYEYVQWSFPILQMMSLFTAVKCNNGLNYSDLDVMSPSSILPTWRNETLAFFTNPLAVIFANPASLGVGVAECAMLAVSDKGMNSWPGVAGCWGNVYPLSGYTSESASPMTGQSLLVARSLAFSVGVGLEQYTVGSKAMCEPEYNPNIIKDRFKFSVFYPRSEKGSHPIGKPSLLFGEWLNKYEGADSFVNIVFKYGECCLRK